jgi:hypothetical protein
VTTQTPPSRLVAQIAGEVELIRCQEGRPRLSNELLVRLIHAHDRARRIVRFFIEFEHIFHRRDELSTLRRREAPAHLPVRL